MTAAPIAPVYAMVRGATVLTFAAEAKAFACLQSAERYLKERGFSVGRWQEGAPAGILHEAGVDIRKWRDLSFAHKDALDGQMTGDGRHGPITVIIDAEASRAAHIDALLPQPSVALPPPSSGRGMTLAIAGMFASLAALGVLLFLPRLAPVVVQRHGAVEQLFLAPKIGLRAKALGHRAPIDEARR